MSSDNLKATIGRLNLLTITAALCFHAIYVMPCLSELRKDNKHGQLCTVKTRQAIRRTLVWLVIWTLELSVGSLYYTHLSPEVKMYSMSLRTYVELFTALYSTIAFTPAIMAQVDLVLALRYPQRGIKGDRKDDTNGQRVWRTCQYLTRSVELMAVLRFLMSFGGLGGNYRREMYMTTVFLDFCISFILLISASISFVYFLKNRPSFRYSFPISPMVPHVLSVVRHIVDAGAAMNIKYKQLMNPRFRHEVYWEASQVICAGWSMIACLLIICIIQSKKIDTIGWVSSKSG